MTTKSTTGYALLCCQKLNYFCIVPDMPMVKIIPVYSGAQLGLLRIKANITDEQVGWSSYTHAVRSSYQNVCT